MANWTMERLDLTIACGIARREERRPCGLKKVSYGAETSAKAYRHKCQDESWKPSGRVPEVVWKDETPAERRLRLLRVAQAGTMARLRAEMAASNYSHGGRTLASKIFGS